MTDYAEHSVLMWAEANKDIVCSSIEQMADLQEAVVYTEMLTSGGEHDIGLDTFAMAAALNTNPNMRYDFTKYRNPWAVPQGHQSILTKKANASNDVQTGANHRYIDHRAPSGHRRIEGDCYK